MEKKIAFLGTPNFAVPILRSLHINGYQISCVFSQPPRKSDRGKKVNKSPIQVAAEELNIQVKTPEKIELDTDLYKKFKIRFSYCRSLWTDIAKNNFRFK